MNDIRKYINILSEIDYDPGKKKLEIFIDPDAVDIVYSAYDVLSDKTSGFVIPPWRLFDYNTISDIQNEVDKLEELVYQFKNNHQIYNVVQLMKEYISDDRTNFPDNYLNPGKEK